MTNKTVNVEIIGLSSKAEGASRAHAENFSTFLPRHGIDTHIYGYTRGSIRGTGKYITIISRLYPRRHLIFLGLFFVAPFLPIRKKAVIMVNMEQDVIPFMLFYPHHPKIIRVTGPTQSIEVNYSRLTSWLYYRLEWLAFRGADKLVVMDKISENYLRERYRIPESKIRFINIGVDLNTFKPLDKQQARETMGLDREKEIMLYVGRLIRGKNVKLLLNSFAKVRKMRRDVALLLAGGGAHETELKQYVEQHRITDVRFLGHVDHDDMPMLMNCADVFAFPSLTEGDPRVVKEALACGVPVVSTPVGTVLENISDGENGCIVKPEINSFVSGLLKALEDKNKLREGVIKRREELSIETSMKKYAEVFRELYHQTYNTIK